MLIILTPLPGVGVAHLRKAEDHQIGMDIGSCHCPFYTLKVWTARASIWACGSHADRPAGSSEMTA